MLKILRQLFCTHQWITTDQVVEGVTIDWGGEPTRQIGWKYRCDLCGKQKYSGGYIIHHDKHIHPEFYDEEGWPIDEKGDKLPNANEKHHS